MRRTYKYQTPRLVIEERGQTVSDEVASMGGTNNCSVNVRPESVVFNGITFRRYLDAKRRTDRMYFVPGIADRARGIESFHREIWKSAFGPIPKGYHVHHKDGNPLNNNLDNLEIVPGSKHISDHMKQNPPGADHMAQIRPKATAWHRSAAGRDWHRQQGKENMEHRQPTTHVCVHCDKAFQSKRLDERVFYCSNACRCAARRKQGVDNVQRLCSICGTAFTVNKHSTAQTCSRRCRWGLRRSVSEPPGADVEVMGIKPLDGEGLVS